jgi:hypothetical protein
MFVQFITDPDMPLQDIAQIAKGVQMGARAGLSSLSRSVARETGVTACPFSSV